MPAYRIDPKSLSTIPSDEDYGPEFLTKLAQFLAEYAEPFDERGHIPGAIHPKNVERLMSEGMIEILVASVPATASSESAPRLETSDRLDEIFSRQLALMEKFGLHPNQLRFMPFGTIADLTMKIGYALIREVVEVVDETPWKWWRKRTPIRRKELKEEVVDVFHFVLELACIHGMSAQELYEGYCEKNSANHERIMRELERTERGIYDDEVGEAKDLTQATEPETGGAVLAQALERPSMSLQRPLGAPPAGALDPVPVRLTVDENGVAQRTEDMTMLQQMAALKFKQSGV